MQVDILRTDELKLLELAPSSVRVELKVTKHTEGSIELPIEFINIPSHMSIKTFPDRVTVRYNIALEDYEKIKPTDFKAVVDYSEATKEKNKLKVKLVKIPAKINSPKISPEKVEFIIRK